MDATVQNEITIRELLLKLKDWVLYFKTKWLIIVIGGLIGGLLGLNYAYRTKTVYVATLSFALEDEKVSAGGGLSGLASQFGFDVGGGAGGAFSGINNLVDLMKSRSMIERTLLTGIPIKGREISFADYYIEFNDWRKAWTPAENATFRFPIGVDRAQFNLQQDSILGLIYKDLAGTVSVAQKDLKISVVNLTARSVNEPFAKHFSEGLARKVSEFYVETKSKKARLNMEILSKQVDSVRGELDRAISSVASTNDNTYNLNPAFNSQRVPSTRRQIDVQANATILTELTKNLELARVTLRKETPLIQVIDRPILPLDKIRVGKFRSMVTWGLLAGALTLVVLAFIRWWQGMFGTKGKTVK